MKNYSIKQKTPKHRNIDKHHLNDLAIELP